MGAENSVLEGCEWGEEVLSAGLDWDLQHALSKDGRLITVFQPRKNERKYNDMIQQLAKSLKMMRHPSILRYIGAGKTSEGYFLVTEEATPLAAVLDKLSPLDVCAGLSDILDALMFLHDKAGVTHNNVSVAAIFVAQDGSWKLGELQHACPFNTATTDFLDSCRAFRDQAALSPEEKQGKVEVTAGQGHTRDMYSIGVLVEQLTEQLSEIVEYSKNFEQKIGACLSADPTHRPRTLELKNDRLFQSDFIQILNFVRNVALKTTEEKSEFFSGLLPRLQALPEDLVARRLAIPLLSRFVLLDEAAVTHVVPHLLTPRPDPESTSPPLSPHKTPLLSTALFEAHIIPELQRIMLVHDAHIRLVLLQHFAAYVHLFDTELLRTDIFPQILLGLRDTSDALVASSLRALADLVPYLGGDVVIGGQRKTFFFHGMPKFSAHKELVEGPGNVTDILKPDVSVTLSNGKPLLKDLAAGSKAAFREAEQTRKALERERRREEARQRKEERQRKLKLQQMKAAEQEDKGKSPDHKEPSMTSHDDLSILGSTPVGKDTDTSQNDKLDDDTDDSETEMSSKNKSVTVNNSISVEAEKFASEESEDEWEDWDESESSAKPRSHDDIISDEIETELLKMSSGSSPRGGGRKVPTSPDPYKPASATEVDWSDAGFSSVIESDAPPGKDSNKQDSTELSSSSSNTGVKQSSGKGLKLVTKSKTATTAKTAQPKKDASGNNLGLGYDIKTIELPTVNEVDFFADMMPEIKPVQDKGMMGMEVQSETSLPAGSGKEPGASSRFAVADAVAQDDTGGWGEEGDWGAEDF